MKNKGDDRYNPKSEIAFTQNGFGMFWVKEGNPNITHFGSSLFWVKKAYDIGALYLKWKVGAGL